MPDQVNKKLGRAVDFRTDGSLLADLSKFDPTQRPHTFERVATVSRDEAHRWFHGNEHITDKAAPSVDEMLEAIAVKLQEDVKNIMLACSTSEHWLQDMYSRSKERGPSVSPPWR